MTQFLEVVLPKNKEELKKTEKLIKEGKVLWGGIGPTKEQLDSVPLEEFNKDN